MDNRYDQGRYNTQGLNPYDYSNLGLTILYLVVIVGGVVGNGLFSYVVIKNRNLHRSAHFLLASLAVRDVVVAISVVPFVIDSQVCRESREGSPMNDARDMGEGLWPALRQT